MNIKRTRGIPINIYQCTKISMCIRMLQSTSGIKKLLLLSVIVLFAGLFLVEDVDATPTLTSFSSTGGNPVNKDNNQDIMYLVGQGDALTFSVTITGSAPLTYEWQVNKVTDESAAADTFAWTVPNEKGIWEIHLNVSNTEGEAHKEWVVSTLTTEEAPDFFDYFSDGKYWNRTDTDPWGRPLPEWGETNSGDYIKDNPTGIYNSDKRYLERKPDLDGKIFAGSLAAYGTWKIRYQGSLAYIFIHPGEDSNGRIQSTYGNYHYSHAATGGYTGHLWLEGKHKASYYGEPYAEKAKRYSLAYKRGINEYGSYLSYIPGWVELKIIRTKDGAFYVYVNDKLTLDTFNIDNTYALSKYIWTGSKIIDDVEIYKEKYLFPEKSAEYKQYGKDDVRKGIVINGSDVRLSEIANFINNGSLFTYDRGTKTAVSYTNLVVEGGAELIIEDETLRMHSNSDGEHEIRIMQGSTFQLINSMVTSDNGYYYLWKFTSPFTREYMPQGGFGDGYGRARNIFIARDSVIDNSGFMYLESPRGIILENTQITNLVEVNSGGSGVSSNTDGVSPLDASFWFKETMATVPYRSFKNLLISGKNSLNPVDIVFEGGDSFGELNIYDSTFENAIIEVKSHNRWGGLLREDWGSYYGRSMVSRTLNLINSKFENLKPVDKFSYIEPKYYLDVKVVDETGNPVQGAKVTVTNENDNANHPAENLLEEWNWTNTYYEGYGGHLVPYKKWTSVDDDVKAIRKPALSTVVTGGDGHTPLPSDPENSLVVTDYRLSDDANADIIRVQWFVSGGSWRIILYVTDDEKGEILYFKKAFGDYNLFVPGERHHAQLFYDKETSSVRLVVKDQNDNLLLDTGEMQLKTQDRQTVLYPNLKFNKVGFGVNNYHDQEEIYWNGAGVYMYSPPYTSGGYLKAEIDNMKLDVTGQGLSENNDYSSDPGLTTIEGDSDKEYSLSQGTGGESFVWEFDMDVIDHNQAYAGWANVELRGYLENPQTNFTYNVTACYNSICNSKTIDPDSSWYRSNPNSYQNTVTLTVGPPSFDLTVNSPTNTTYNNVNITISGSTNGNANIIYSLNGEANITICTNCPGFTDWNNSTNEGSNYITVYGVNYTSSSDTDSKTIWFTIDTTPPSSLTNLENQLQGENWIHWNWSNPTDSDFNHTEVWINGTFYANVSNSVNYYNATGLNPDTWYEIQTRTVDIHGNVNTNWVNNTAQTLEDTTAPVISFVSPTPSNKNTSNTWAYINVTMNKAIHTAILEWNGSTETAWDGNISNTNFFINKTNLNGNYTFKVYATDSSGDMGISKISWVNANVTNTQRLTISIQSPQNITYSYKNISLNYTADASIDTCLVSVDGTANQTLNCKNQSVISSEYEDTTGTGGRWHFNGGTGSTATDSSGKGNDGTLNGTNWVDGKFGKALNFDGLDDHVEIVNPSLNLTNQITLETWIKTPITGRHTILDRWLYGTGVNQRSFELDVDSDGRINFGLSPDGTSTNAVWIKSAGTVSTNTWTHIAAVSDGVTMKIYINGEQDQSTATAPSAIYSSTTNLNIGSWFTGGTWWYPFNGTIDEARILNRPLTEDEIKADYALEAGSHNITVYASDTSGNWNSTTRYFTVLYSHTLLKGWNTVTFTGYDNTPVESSLSSADYSVIWGGIDDILKAYIAGIGGNFDSLTSGKTYKIRVNSNTTWTYPVP